MPQGVEHFGWTAHGPSTLVRIPLMPQGVEHLRGALGLSHPMAVRIPLMPQGVEHPTGWARKRRMPT